MKSFSPFSIVSALLLASTALAQRQTITLPYEDGDTIVVSLSTDPLRGITVTQTLATVTGTALTTTPTTARTTTARTTALTTALTTTQDDDDDGRPTTTGPRVVGQQESMAPMRTTTYGYDPGNGVWTTATWTASVTAEPTVATYIPPAGTIADYEEYQSRVNKQVFASAQAAAENAAVRTGAGERRADVKVGGKVAWAGAVMGAVGAVAAFAL